MHIIQDEAPTALGIAITIAIVVALMLARDPVLRARRYRNRTARMTRRLLARTEDGNVGPMFAVIMCIIVVGIVLVDRQHGGTIVADVTTATADLVDAALTALGGTR